MQTTSSGTPRRPVDEVVDEVEQAVVGPVQILEDEDERALLGERLEEPPPGRERLRLPVAAGVLSRRPSPTSGRRWPSTHSASDVVDQASATLRRSFSLGLVRRVGLEDSGLGLDHLARAPSR